MSLRFVFTIGIATCKPAIVKERKKNVKKRSMENVLMTKTIMKYSKILKFYILNPLQIDKFLQQKDHLKALKTEMTFFILIGVRANSS